MKINMNTLTFEQIKIMHGLIKIKQEMILKHSPLKSGLPDDPEMIVSFIRLMKDDHEFTTNFISDVMEYAESKDGRNEKQLQYMIDFSNEHIKSIMSELRIIYDMIANI